MYVSGFGGLWNSWIVNPNSKRDYAYVWLLGGGRVWFQNFLWYLLY